MYSHVVLELAVLCRDFRMRPRLQCDGFRCYTGGCDIVRLPAYEATSYIMRGVDLQIHSMRIQVCGGIFKITHPMIGAVNMLVE